MRDSDGCPSRILIVDDEPQITGLLSDYLSDNYGCTVAGSAEEALALLAKERFHLILSDIQMAGISGLEMVPRLLELVPDALVVMISGTQTIESAIEAMRVGAFDYVTKPFNLTQVGAAVRRALDHQSLREANRQAETRLRQIVEHATDIIFRTDAGGRLTLVNPAAATLMKSPAEKLVGLSYLELVRPDWREAAGKFYGSQLHGKVACSYYEFPAMAGGEAEIWLGQNVQLLNVGGRVVGLQAVARDITRQRYYDAGTGLPNRVLFDDRLARALICDEGVGRAEAVMLISPDRFKRYVETLGHEAGETVLRGIAERLIGCLDGADLLARYGEDEFSLLLSRIGGGEGVARLSQRVREALKQPFSVDGHEIYVTVSMGAALPPREGADALTVTRNAESALLRAREKGGSNLQFYAEEMNAEAFSRLSLESGLRRAIERREFTIHYQPQMDVVRGCVVGAEALVRWRHPGGGLVPPAEFIPLAEETGLIVPLDEWVLREACAQNKAWQDAGLPPLRISTNFSARMFHRPGITALVSRVLSETGLEARLLDLELTESSVMSNASTAAETLAELRGLGVHISIDDFGTGYSSLNYLKKFPADCLKIDQSFVREVANAPHDAAIVGAIVTLAHSLGLKVIAEGVETEGQLRFLASIGCDEAQGFLLGRPLPAEEFSRNFLEGSRYRLGEVEADEA